MGKNSQNKKGCAARLLERSEYIVWCTKDVDVKSLLKRHFLTYFSGITENWRCCQFGPKTFSTQFNFTIMSVYYCDVIQLYCDEKPCHGNNLLYISLCGLFYTSSKRCQSERALVFTLDSKFTSIIPYVYFPNRIFMFNH